MEFSTPYFFSTISVMEYFKVDFIYNFQMSYYPFDNQILTGRIEPEEHDMFFVQLVAGSINYSGPSDLMKYTIKNYTVSNLLVHNCKLC